MSQETIPSSTTLAAIMRHWTTKLPAEEPGVVDLPFNIEAFCRENDERLAQVRAEALSEGFLECRDMCVERGYIHPDGPAFAILTGHGKAMKG